MTNKRALEAAVKLAVVPSFAPLLGHQAHNASTRKRETDPLNFYGFYLNSWDLRLVFSRETIAFMSKIPNKPPSKC